MRLGVKINFGSQPMSNTSRMINSYIINDVQGEIK